MHALESKIRKSWISRIFVQDRTNLMRILIFFQQIIVKLILDTYPGQTIKILLTTLSRFLTRPFHFSMGHEITEEEKMSRK